MLDTRVIERLGGPRRVLLAGCGGGYDVLGAVPLRHALRAAGIEVELASLSFAYLNGLEAKQDGKVMNLYAVDTWAATERDYCPEAWLARWLDDREPERPHVVWSFDKTGVRTQPALVRVLLTAAAPF